MTTTPASDWRDTANAHFKAKRWTEMASVCSEVLARDPDDADALALRGSARINLANPEGAADDLGRAVARDPARINARYNLGLALVKLGRHEKALVEFEAYLAASPDDADARQQRAACKASMGQIEIEDGRLVAPPRALGKVPAAMCVEQTFGWGWPAFALTLVLGGLKGAIAPVRTAVPASSMATLQIVFAGCVLVGVLAFALHVRAMMRRVVLVGTTRGIAVYRRGVLVAEASPGELGSYAHSGFNTLFFLATFGLTLWLAARFYATDPGVALVLAPVAVMLASNLRSRIMLTHIHVLRGEGAAMFPSGAFSERFGNVRRWTV